ncbi:SDR family oxidoreductase [Metabacillus rhizolycopersici]|uniref:SDR family oxidoreductase n=1 Tax=Metabacillus rhizolycopersici TaxID=2875709 RepID=A0ABS7UVJ7_9BACI|nr:SDR family oxidoreductase [Metabacillus rhizolycopersici]MBZ5751975.1 SDR family oxidoreductase [Metabacillus rhizolycopersici]
MKKLEDLFNLKGKTALISGGAGYLGNEISYTLAELGATVILASRDFEKCKNKCIEIKERLGPHADAIPMELNLMNKDSISETFTEIEEKFGGLDILVNNAWSGKKNSFESISDQDWEYDIAMSLNSVFYCIKKALPGLKQKKGIILNITSMYGHVAPDYRIYDGIQFTNPPSYGAAKAGVIQFTKYLASFLSPYDIRVNCLSPGAFPHEITQQNQTFIDQLSAKNPMNRIGKPHEIKGAVALLCSDASSYMTGQHLCVDGGWSIW